MSLTLMGIAVIPQVSAGVSSDMVEFFNSIGYSNLTNPSAYQGQSAGYYSGGSIYARSPAKNYQLLSFNLPSVRAGCGGIDLWGGSFSFINESQLVAMLRNIGQNAVGFAFNLALSTISPKTEELVNKMQAYANQINAMNVNSCETAAALVGGMWPKTDESQKQVCQSIGTSQGLFSDWAAARQGCGAEGQRTSTLQAGKSGPFKELVFDQGNIAWKALKKNDWTKSDTELAQLIMNITGTLILRRTGGDDAPIIPLSIAPVLSEKGLNAFMWGGRVRGFKCKDGTGEDQCLTLTRGSFYIKSGFAERVTTLLNNIVTALRTETPLPAGGAEIGLLNATSLPVYKMLNVFTAYNPGMASQKADDYAEIIATDILFNYLQTATDAALYSSRILQLPSELLEQFIGQVAEQKSLIASKREEMLAKAERSIQMIEETMLIERTLISTLSPGLAGSYNWSKILQ